jgi:4-carboxymuconolactone decarboxylase
MTATSSATGPSFAPVPLDSTDPEVQAAYAKSYELFGHVSDLFARLANAPTLLGGWIDMLRPIRRSMSVDPHLSELLTLRVAQLQGAQLMVASHTRLASMAGVPEEKVAAVTDWRTSSVLGPVEQAVLELAEQVTERSAADDELVVRLQESIGVRATLELVIVASYYCCTTRVANVVRSEPFRFEDE